MPYFFFIYLISQAITTITIEEDIQLNRRKFEDFLEKLQWEKNVCNSSNVVMEVMRIKVLLFHIRSTSLMFLRTRPLLEC